MSKDSLTLLWDVMSYECKFWCYPTLEKAQAFAKAMNELALVLDKTITYETGQCSYDPCRFATWPKE